MEAYIKQKNIMKNVNKKRYFLEKLVENFDKSMYLMKTYMNLYVKFLKICKREEKE